MGSWKNYSIINPWSPHSHCNMHVEAPHTHTRGWGGGRSIRTVLAANLFLIIWYGDKAKLYLVNVQAGSNRIFSNFHLMFALVNYSCVMLTWPYFNKLMKSNTKGWDEKIYNLGLSIFNLKLFWSTNTTLAKTLKHCNGIIFFCIFHYLLPSGIYQLQLYLFYSPMWYSLNNFKKAVRLFIFMANNLQDGLISVDNCTAQFFNISQLWLNLWLSWW